MINLLPYDYKEQIQYGRKNKTLIGWIFAITVAMLVIIAVSAVGTLYMLKTTNDYQKTVESNRQLQTGKKLDQNYKQLEGLASNFKTVVDIASQQLIYSNIIKAIAPLLPPDTELNGLELTQGQYGVDIKINGANESVLTQAFINISNKNNKIFEKADFNNVTCKDAAGNTADEKYPCKANIKGLLAKNSNFYFINTGGNK